MADPVGSLKQIAEVALKINEAVEMVRQNKKDCLRIGRRVERARLSLSLCENNAELMKESAASAALEALGEILGEALVLVTACQERSFVCLCWTAGKLSKQLSKVDQDISSIHSDATLAILAILFYIISTQNRDGAHPPPPSLERPMAPAPEPELCPPPPGEPPRPLPPEMPKKEKPQPPPPEPELWPPPPELPKIDKPQPPPPKKEAPRLPPPEPPKKEKPQPPPPKKEEPRPPSPKPELWPPPPKPPKEEKAKPPPPEPELWPPPPELPKKEKAQPPPPKKEAPRPPPPEPELWPPPPELPKKEAPRPPPPEPPKKEKPQPPPRKKEEPRPPSPEPELWPPPPEPPKEEKPRPPPPCPPPPEPPKKEKPQPPPPEPVVRARIPSPSPRADHLPSSLADQAEERNLLPEIDQVALMIKEAVQTVRQNKEECIQIDKRVNRVNALLSSFENTETMKDPEMIAQLEELLKTFRRAHTLVTACQRRNITIISPAGRLSEQLRDVLDQTELTLAEMISISARCAGMV